MMKKRIVTALAAAFAAFGAIGADKNAEADAIKTVLNSRAAGSPRKYAEAAKVVAEYAEAGRPLQRFIMAVLSDDRCMPDELRISPELRRKYLESSRAKIRELAEKKSNPIAWYLLSLETNDMKLLKRAAEGGNVQALNAWGTVTLTQILSNPEAEPAEIERVVEKSFACFKRAAAEKDANGLYNLGMCYLNGYGCDPDADKAFDCFRMAAEKEHPEAINNIGGFYRDGIVVEKDPVVAAKWFAKSAALGNPYGQLNYALALQRGEGVAQDSARAAKLLLESAEQGSAEAMNAYGMCLYAGDGLEKDERAAVAWYFKSAAHGFAPAMENLAECYDIGAGGLEKNHEKGTVWKIRARAARGDRNAIAWLTQNGYSLK